MTEMSNAPNIRALVDLANRDGVDIRPTLLRVMTDLYVQMPRHSEQEEQQFTELALRLIDLVDPQTRAIVAEKITAYAQAPAAVRHRLLRDYVVIKPAPPAEIAEPMPTTEATVDELSELFFAASGEERRLILKHLPYTSLPAAEPVPAAVARDTVLRLETAAFSHNGEQFARELERALGFSRNHARRLIEDDTGEAFVVVAIALGMAAEVLQRILLCLNPSISQSIQKVYELIDLHEQLDGGAASQLIGIWQAAHPVETRAPARQAQHQPQYWHDERGGRVAPSPRPAIRWQEHARSRNSESA